MPAYSVLVTSCDRDDLLERTIKTFVRTADTPPSEIVIINDGPDRPCPAFLNRYKHLRLKWICNGERRGQIYTCDRLWQECKHDYAMWLEDDWAFNGNDYIKKSFDILLKYPEVITVSLRGPSGWHTLVSDPRFPFKIAEPNWKGGWGGFTFNCGLRRKSDYMRLGSYGRHVGYGSHGLGHEMTLSKLHASLGYVIADLNEVIVTHTGVNRSRAIEAIQTKVPKILIAVPACWKLNYGKWESENSPLFDRSTAWNGTPYGTDIHLSGPNPRTEAVRATWWNDCKLFPNVTARFFYGSGATRPLCDDEVMLSVPDDYEHLPHKTMAICQWALDNDFDYVFKCDDDSYLWVDRLMIEIQTQPLDFAGHISGGTCAGGAGYILSRRAIKEVVRNPITVHWAEDCTIGIIMKAARIIPINLPRHRSGIGGGHWCNITEIPEETVCVHAVKPEDMIALYKSQKFLT